MMNALTGGGIWLTVILTAVRMDEAFLELLERKDFSYITVKEICQKAGVNRSTFYLHYETIDDLVLEGAQHIIRQLIEFMPYDTTEFLKKLPDCPLEELYLIESEYLTPYLTFIREHRRIFRLSLEQASLLKMENAYDELFRHVFTPILNRFLVPPAVRKYMMPFYINGLIAIISEWLKEDCKDSIEQIISVMQACVPAFRG